MVAPDAHLDMMDLVAAESERREVCVQPALEARLAGLVVEVDADLEALDHRRVVGGQSVALSWLAASVWLICR